MGGKKKKKTFFTTNNVPFEQPPDPRLAGTMGNKGSKGGGSDSGEAGGKGAPNRGDGGSRGNGTASASTGQTKPKPRAPPADFDPFVGMWEDRLSGAARAGVMVVNADLAEHGVEGPGLPPAILGLGNHLTTLVLDSIEGLASLDGIGSLAGLRDLAVRRCPGLKSVTDIEPLSQLEALDLRGNSIKVNKYWPGREP